MVKLPLRKLIGVFSILIFFSSCYLSRVNLEKKEIYIEKIENLSYNPELTFVLPQKIRETILNYPGYNITDEKEKADYILNLKILKFERYPIFYSREDADNIVGARFEIEVEMNMKERDGKEIKKVIKETFSSSIFKEYNEEEIISRISERIAKKFYFEILKKQ